MIRPSSAIIIVPALVAIATGAVDKRPVGQPELARRQGGKRRPRQSQQDKTAMYALDQLSR